MRLIGHLENETYAQAFSDFLYAQGIDNHIEAESSGAWALWVLGEDQLETANRLLVEFQQNPDDPKYSRASQVAREKRERERKEQKAAEKRYFDRAKLFPDTVYGIGTVTAILIVISLVVGVFSRGAFALSPLAQLDSRIVQPLSISVYEAKGRYLESDEVLPEVRRGEVWRLITPIFIHFGVLHLLFNLLWLKDLGSMVEHLQGRVRLLALVLAIAVLSNLAQYYVAGPMFGGMSGVVYGLLGYIWLRGRFDPASGLYVDRTTVVLMVIWFFLCLFGIIPNVANTVHAVGLGFGLITGYLSALVATRHRP